MSGWSSSAASTPAAPSAGDGDDLEVLDRGEQVAHPLAEDRVVVDDEDADHAASPPPSGAAPRRRARRAADVLELDAAAELGGALAHRAQADAGGRRPRVRPRAVVGDLEHRLVAVRAQLDAAAPRVGVADAFVSASVAIR